jgi:hypothetical protein
MNQTKESLKIVNQVIEIDKPVHDLEEFRLKYNLLLWLKQDDQANEFIDS